MFARGRRECFLIRRLRAFRFRRSDRSGIAPKRRRGLADLRNRRSRRFLVRGARRHALEGRGCGRRGRRRLRARLIDRRGVRRRGGGRRGRRSRRRFSRRRSGAGCDLFSHDQVRPLEVCLHRDQSGQDRDDEQRCGRKRLVATQRIVLPSRPWSRHAPRPRIDRACRCGKDSGAYEVSRTLVQQCARSAMTLCDLAVLFGSHRGFFHDARAVSRAAHAPRNLFIA